MYALFHVVPYEGSDFLGVFSTLEAAQAAGAEQVAAVEHQVGIEDIFHGWLEVYPVELDQGFKIGFLEQPLWTFKSSKACY